MLLMLEMLMMLPLPLLLLLKQTPPPLNPVQQPNPLRLMANDIVTLRPDPLPFQNIKQRRSAL